MSMSEIIIRPSKMEDVNDLWRYTYEDKTREEVEVLVKRYIKKYKKELRLRVVAEVDGKVIARSRFKKKRHGLKKHIVRGWGAYVNEEYRGKGIAGKMFDFGEEWMRERGGEKLVITVRAGTVSEKVFRRRTGYKEFGRLPGGSIKDGKYWDVVYLYKNL